MSTTPAIDDRQYGVDHDPPNCYYEDGVLKFNVFGQNTGACSDEDVCLCTQSVIAVPDCACYCDSELESFTTQGGLLLLSYVVGSFFATVACLRTTQKQVTKLRSLRAWVFSVLLWLLPIKFNSFNNMAQSRPDFPDTPLFLLRTIENVALGVVIWWYEPIPAIKIGLIAFPLGTIALFFSRYLHVRLSMCGTSM